MERIGFVPPVSVNPIGTGYLKEECRKPTNLEKKEPGLYELNEAEYSLAIISAASNGISLQIDKVDEELKNAEDNDFKDLLERKRLRLVDALYNIDIQRRKALAALEMRRAEYQEISYPKQAS